MSVQSVTEGNLALTSLEITNTRLFDAGVYEGLSLDKLKLEAGFSDYYSNYVYPSFNFTSENGYTNLAFQDVDVNFFNGAFFYDAEVALFNPAKISYYIGGVNDISTKPLASQYTPVGETDVVEVKLGTIYTFGYYTKEGVNYYPYSQIFPNVDNQIPIPLADANGGSINNYLPAGTYMVTFNATFPNNVTPSTDYIVNFNLTNLRGTAPNQVDDFASTIQDFTLYATSDNAGNLPNVSGSFPIYISDNNTNIQLYYVSNDFPNTPYLYLEADIQTKFMRIA
jgi:hypothetical protein